MIYTRTLLHFSIEWIQAGFELKSLASRLLQKGPWELWFGDLSTTVTGLLTEITFTAAMHALPSSTAVQQQPLQLTISVFLHSSESLQQ
jgi:hypothetical protein